MKLLLYLHLLLLLLFTSCGSDERNEGANAASASDTLNIPAAPDTGAVAGVTRKAIGYWRGQIPCADCPGIDYSLTLFQDNTFQEQLLYQDRSTEPVIYAGSWEVTPDSIITLTSRNNNQEKLQLHPKGLYLLDLEGERITGDLADKYLLTPDPPVNIASYTLVQLRQKKQSGIDFIAMGNKPEWVLEVDHEKMLNFSNLWGTAMNVRTPFLALKKATRGDTLTFTTQTEAGSMEVNIIKQPCSISGKAFNYTTVIRLNDRSFRGCGQYLNDERIDGEWALQLLNNEAIKADDYPNGVPYIAFDIRNNKVSGNGSCNRFSGSYFMEGSRLRFSALVSTRMACPMLEVEQQLMKILNSKNLTFSVDPGRLTLFQEANPVAVFKRIEEDKEEE